MDYLCIFSIFRRLYFCDASHVTLCTRHLADTKLEYLTPRKISRDVRCYLMYWTGDFDFKKNLWPFDPNVRVFNENILKLFKLNSYLAEYFCSSLLNNHYLAKAILFSKQLLCNIRCLQLFPKQIFSFASAYFSPSFSL